MCNICFYNFNICQIKKVQQFSIHSAHWKADTPTIISIKSGNFSNFKAWPVTVMNF